LDEQKWVQNAIEDSFKKTKVSFSKSDPYTSQAGHLAHIKTDFTAKCSIKQASQFVINLHPTPAVCGTPKQETQNEIFQIEKHNRYYYSGYLGLYSPQQFNLFVNLRCMLIDPLYFYLFVGGGLTKDSDPLLEWQETENKAQTLSSIIDGLQ
jgi:isochorismate synthase